MPRGIYHRLSLLVPKPFIDQADLLLDMGGFKRIDGREYAGFALFFSACAALVAFFITPFLPLPLFFAFLLPGTFFIACLGLFALTLVNAAETRARQIEALLPTALQIASSNIRAGMTLERALWAAARPEFGPLRQEIQRIAALTFSGTPLKQSVSGFARRMSSSAVGRAVLLIRQGIVMGGSMAPLLEEVARDVQTRHELEREIQTATTTYTLFIVFAAVLAAPLLFSASVFYAELNDAVSQRQGAPVDRSALIQAGVSGLPGYGQAQSPGGIDPDSMRLFALAVIAVTTTFAGLILGQIRHGNPRRGVQWIPAFWLVGFTLFFGASALLRNVFSFFLK